MKTEQLELHLASGRTEKPLVARSRRQQISHWWFGQMRLAVDRAPNEPSRTSRANGLEPLEVPARAHLLAKAA